MDSEGKEESGSETHLFRSDRSLARLPEFLNYTWVASKVLFASNKDDRQTSAEMHNFGNPLRERIGSEFAFQGMEKSGKGRKKKHTFSWTLSSESGESTAKQMRIT